MLLRDGSLTPEQAVNVTDQVGRALDAAVRSRGLIHRDVKPANILLANNNDGVSGHVYLCDFGLAKQVGSSSGLTGTGAVIGTIDYMAPEQIREDIVDGRADVYSLGCVVYHLLTGHAPFQGSAAKVMWSHLNEQVQPVSESASIPPATDGVLAKALAKDPLERYQDCGHLVHDLRAALSGSSLNPLPGSPASGYHPSAPGSAPDVVRTAACAAAGGIAPAVGARRPAPGRDCRRGRGDRPGSSTRLRRYAWRQPRRRQRPQLRPGSAPQPACRGCFRRLGGRGLANRPPGTLTRLAVQRARWAGPYHLTSRPVGLAWAAAPSGWSSRTDPRHCSSSSIRPVGRSGRFPFQAGPRAPIVSISTHNPVLTESTIWVPLVRSVVPVTREGHVGTPIPVKDGVVADMAIAGSRLWIIAGRASTTSDSTSPRPRSRPTTSSSPRCCRST